MSPQAAFRLILALFFLWGFLTCLNDILLPYSKFIFGLSYEGATAMPVAFFSTCFVFAPLAAKLISRLGYTRTMAVALLIMSAGALCFLAAAAVREFWCFLAAIIVLGAGITILQVAAAPYVSFLVPPERSPSRFSLALGFNSLGTMIAPLFGSWLILRGQSLGGAGAALTGTALAAARLRAFDQIRSPYFFLAISLAALSAAVSLSHLPRMTVTARLANTIKGMGMVLRHKPLIFGAITGFLYCGAEIGIGSLLINYLGLPDVGALAPHSAALLVSFYWGSATLGRFVGWRMLRKYRVETVLALCGVSATALLTVSVLSSGYIAIVSVLAIGLCNAMIVPVVVMLSISGLGEKAAKASSVMTAANIGGGLMPLAMGALADRIGLHYAFLLPVVSYLCVVFYALYGASSRNLKLV